MIKTDGRKRRLETYIQPDLIVNRLEQIKPDWLRKRGIQLICLDVDNTLIEPDHDQYLKNISWISGLKKEGFEVVLMSNNFSRTIKKAASDAGLKAYLFSCKPLGFTFKKAGKDHRVSAGHAVLIGDQLLTDMLGARRAGYQSIYLNLPQKRMRPDQKLIHWMECLLFPALKTRKTHE